MKRAARRIVCNLLVAVAFALSAATPALAVTISDICRVKGQESMTLHGHGLVVGLPGTGDDAAPTAQALARTMALFGTLSPGLDLDELKKGKNAALVHVTAKLPAEGIREGGRVNVRVSSLGAKSLAGGLLTACPLVGPNPGDRRVFAEATGQITIEDESQPTVGVVQFGARMLRNVANPFHQDGYVSFVLESKHASFRMAQEIEYAINEDKEFEGQRLARALDPTTVVVRIPESYVDAPVLFVTALQHIPLDAMPGDRRVVIFERSGVISIGSRVEIRPSAISHKNLVIEVAGKQNNQFIPVDPGSDTSVESLTALVTALNALKVSTPDMIEIIKALDKRGALYGELIID